MACYCNGYGTSQLLVSADELLLHQWTEDCRVQTEQYTWTADSVRSPLHSCTTTYSSARFFPTAAHRYDRLFSPFCSVFHSTHAPLTWSGSQKMCLCHQAWQWRSAAAKDRGFGGNRHQPIGRFMNKPPVVYIGASAPGQTLISSTGVSFPLHHSSV